MQIASPHPLVEKTERTVAMLLIRTRLTAVLVTVVGSSESNLLDFVMLIPLMVVMARDTGCYPRLRPGSFHEDPPA
jgi:hypothetical protein